MSTPSFEFLRPDDKPALVAISNPDVQAVVLQGLQEQGFKIHQPLSHEEFSARFTQVPYKVVILDESFDGATSGNNPSLIFIQNLPMPVRRHATVILIGDIYQTLHPLQAFQQSVHAVVNTLDTTALSELVNAVVEENAVFLQAFLDTQHRMIKGG